MPPGRSQSLESGLSQIPAIPVSCRKLCYKQQGDLRVPSIRERETIMGFPLDYSRRCMPKGKEGSAEHNDCRLRLLGNSWSVPVVGVLLYSLFRLLGWMPPLSVQEIVDRLVPGGAADLAGLLLRPPIRHETRETRPGPCLVRKLLGQVSVKGEDILLQMGSDVPARYHRL